MSIEIKPEFFHCGCCKMYHSTAFYGNCRDNSERFTSDDLNRLYGPDGWTEIDVHDVERGE